MSHMDMDDTIAAVATPVGEGGLSVIRISGPEALAVAGKFFFPKGKTGFENFQSHTVHFGEVRDEKGEVIDQGLVTFFRAPRSYTGEDVIEISLHGGLLVTRLILGLVLRQGARMAEPGEFTKRAFLNGRMDLTQAEAVADLIRAKSERSAEVAMRHLAGSLSAKFKTLRDRLMKLYAHMEAYIDFPEEDLEIFSDETLQRELEGVGSEMDLLIASFTRGSLLREGLSCVLVGKPNVGKSSLFNALLERDRALVSEFPGTTRDHLEEALNISGFLIRLSDTAGLFHRSGHPLDEIGMHRTRRAIEGADLILFVVDGSQPVGEGDESVFTSLPKDKPLLVLVNKSDLASETGFESLDRMTGGHPRVRVSAMTRQGFETLEQMITDRIGDEKNLREGEQITRERHKNALRQARSALCRAHDSYLMKQSLELVVVDLKSSLDALRELIGEVYTEDLLDVIFSEFCIGK